MRGIPVRIGRGNLIAGSHDALNDVINIGEIAPHFAVVIDINGLAGENGLGEEEKGHVRAAPGAIDGKKRRPVVGSWYRWE